MKYKIFTFKKLINRYLTKHFPNQEAFFSIVEVERYCWFFHRFVVLFYQKNDLENEIHNVLTDLIANDFKIKIKEIRFNFNNLKNKQIGISLSTYNDNLLVGKFGQNQKSLQYFLMKFLITKFRVKYELFLKFPHSSYRKKPRYEYKEKSSKVKKVD